MIRRVRAPRIDFGALRRELELPERFPPAAQQEADEAASTPPPPGADRTDIPFVTIDPPTSRDLDQAVHLARRQGGGYRVHYAIADVAAFVRPGGALEAETWKRGQTVYLPDGNVPLHPTALSEGAASLLPDVDRASMLWTIDLDESGGTVDIRLERARVRSRAKLDYAGVQASVDAGNAPDAVALLPEIGALLVERGLDRGAVNLPLPEQDVEPDDGGYRLVLRAPEPVEDFNAQISLLTGMAAATLMLKGGIGLLRTMPSPRRDAVERLRAAAKGLGIALARRHVGRTGRGHRRPRRSARRRVPRPGRRADARRRLHGLRRRDPRADRPRWRRRPVRPRDRAPAPPRRPVRDRGLPGALPQRRASRLGEGSAAEAAEGHE